MSLSKRLIAAEYRGPHPLAGWKSAAEWAPGPPAADPEAVTADGPSAPAVQAGSTPGPMQRFTRRGAYLGQLLMFD